MDVSKGLALKDILETIPMGSRIVDVGFGDAEFLKALSEHNFKLWGTEVSGACIDNAYQKLGDRATLIQSRGAGLFPEVDVTCCFEVIEHLEDPLEFLKKLPGGILYLSTPNPHRWLPEITRELFRRPIYEKWDEPPNHLWRFELGVLEDILEKSGWCNIQINTTRVQHHNILSSIVRRKNSDNYDDMRPKHPHITRAIRRCFTPITFIMAEVLTALDYKGVSYYIKAERRNL